MSIELLANPLTDLSSNHYFTYLMNYINRIATRTRMKWLAPLNTKRIWLRTKPASISRLSLTKIQGSRSKSKHSLEVDS